MKNFLKELLERTNKHKNEIIYGINNIEGCADSIKRNTLNRWENKKISGNPSNIKQKGVICFCLYFKLDVQQVYDFLSYLNIKDPKQIDYLIHQIEEQKNHSTFSFYGSDSLEIINFSQMLIDNNLSEKTSIILEDNKTNDMIFFQNISLKTNQDHYIRSLIVNNLSIGGSNAKLEEIALNSIKFIVRDNEINKILSSNQYLGLNLYKSDAIMEFNLKQLCYLNHIDLLLVQIKKDNNLKNCPINVILECMDKTLSLDKERKLFESLKLLEKYMYINTCNDLMIKKLLQKLEFSLLDKQTDILVKIYIIEALGYLYHNDFVKGFVWEVAKKFFKRNIKHSHLIWAFLVTLQSNIKTSYNLADKNFIIDLKYILHEHDLELHSSCIDIFNFLAKSVGVNYE